MKRILSHATLGAVQAVSLSIAAIGKAMAWARREDVTSKHVVDTYGRRFTSEEMFQDVKDLEFGVGLMEVRVKTPERRDRPLLISALAQSLLTLLGAPEQLHIGRLARES